MLIMKKGKVVYSGKADLSVIEEYEAKANETYVWPVYQSPCAHCSIAFRDGAIATFSTASFRDTLPALTAICDKRGWSHPRVFGTPLDKIILPFELCDLPVRPVTVARTRSRVVPVVTEEDEDTEEQEDKPVVVIARRRSHAVPEEDRPSQSAATHTVKRVRAKPRAAPKAGDWLQILQADE